MSTLSTKDCCWVLEIRSDLYGDHNYCGAIGFREYSPRQVLDTDEIGSRVVICFEPYIHLYWCGGY
jgi:hypothetical protein